MAAGARLRAVLFDAAGTLIRLREPVGKTYTRVARDFGVELPPALVEEAFKRTFRGMPPLSFADTHAETAEREWWRELVRRTFDSVVGAAAFTDFGAYFERLFQHYANVGAWAAAPGAQAALTTLRAHSLRTGVVSNFDHRLNGILDGLELTALLDVIVRPADTGVAKPNPRIFAFALQQLGVGADETAYVGDDADEDIAGAAAAGLLPIDVSTLRDLSEVSERIGLSKP